MPDFINHIKNKFPRATVQRCFERGCELRLDGLPRHVVLKGEILSTEKRINDCVIFVRNNPIPIGIVELKSKTIHSSEIEEKLTNGGKIALSIIKECPIRNKKCEFYPIVLHMGCDSSEFRIITKRKISIAGRRHDIIVKRCGVTFAEIIHFLK